MKKLVNSLLVLVLSGLMLACSSQLRLQQGIVSFKNQNYRQAFIRLKPEAVKGNRDAQYAVGYMYYYGQGVIENKKEAIKWITLSANQGQGQAITALKVLNKMPTPHTI